MPGRSLRLSATGVQRAKQALVRRNLIQRSLVDEGIASWSTINKFFNGKPVARNIFLEICHQLDLNWKEIAEFPPESEEIEQLQPIQEEQNSIEAPASPWLKAILQSGASAREALTPRILQPIVRPIVQERYLPAIYRGLKQGLPRIIPLIGPAGYGKSTILGHLYDELVSDPSSWTALLLCNSLYLEPGISAEALASRMAESICGTSQLLFDVTAALTSIHGRGTLLIDTLDLVISRPFVSAFNNVLRQLLEQGVTIVFTCRDHEYNDFLEPTRERLGSIAQNVDRHSVPGFTTPEIRQAAEAFFTHLESSSPEQGQIFADKILTLSADSRPLQEIIQNPLLLALLCDLFANDGNVPTDLTVSKLYKRYWYERIAYSRADHSHSSLLALEKDRLCLAIAQSLFEMSQEKLCESAYRSDFNIDLTSSVADAYDDLLSEGVIDCLRMVCQKIGKKRHDRANSDIYHANVHL